MGIQAVGRRPRVSGRDGHRAYNIHRAIGLDRRYRPERIVEITKHHKPDAL